MDAENSVNFEAIFATLNLIVFLSLVLATPQVPWRRRLGFLVLGLLALNLFQVLYVVVHFTVNFKYGPGSPILSGLQSVSEVAYLLLPMLLWAIMEAPRLFGKRRSRPR
jgi:hypothetical protein